MKKIFIFSLFIFIFLFIFLFFFSFSIYAQTSKNKNMYEIEGSFNYYSGFFPSNIKLTDSSFSNTIYYIYDIKLSFFINTFSKTGLFLFYNGPDWKNPYSIGLFYSYFNKLLNISIIYNLKTIDFLKYHSLFKIFFTLDLYPFYFLKINGTFPFYPERLIFALPSLVTSSLSETFDISVDTGIYIFQNELFAKFKYLNIKDFYSSSSYYYKTQYFYAAGVRLIPTYTLVGYYFELSFTSNNYNNKFKYSFLSASIGLIIKALQNLYIRGILGYNYWYFYTSDLISKENPLFFKIGVQFKI